MTDFTVLVIATNKYSEYAVDLIKSIDERLFTDSTGQVLIFTDQPTRFADLNLERIACTPIEIPSLGWPDATLLRYEIFEQHWGQVAGDFVMYIDADTTVAKNIPISIVKSELDHSRIALVRHPGYYNKTFIENLKSRSFLGTWETRRSSSAFVPFFRRKTYVAGGVWMGYKSEVFELIKTLASHVQIDKQNGIMAKWHDESHLNWWNSTHQVAHLEPSWAFAPGYANISHHEAIIELVHKPQEFFDQRQD